MLTSADPLGASELFHAFIEIGVSCKEDGFGCKSTIEKK